MIDANVVMTIFAFIFLVQSMAFYAIIKLVLTRRTFWETDQLTRKKQRQQEEEAESTALSLAHDSAA